MTLSEFLHKEKRLFRQHGLPTATKSAMAEVFGKVCVRPYLSARQYHLSQSLPHQGDLLDEFRDEDQWTLLVFDAGRYDYLAPLLRDQYRGQVQRTYSDARDTFEWISKTWQGDFDDVTYISGMVPVSDEIPDFDAEDFKRLYDGVNPGDSIGEVVKVWEHEWDDGLATVTPETVTDVALEHASRDKLVVHYAQPHSPFIGTPKLLGHSHNESSKPEGGRPNDEPIWERVRAGYVSHEYLRMAYWGNAVRAIEAAKPLVRERDSVVATADHGEALGEWGMYTHDRAPHPKRRVVPWQRITGITQTGEQRKGDETIDAKLRALGYR